MLSIERREAILQLMQQKRAASVDYLSRNFFISGATIRRDLDKMAREGLVKRTYGGAVLLDGSSSDIPLMLREGENTNRKAAIARAAVGLIADGNTVFLDSSSTVSKLAPLMDGFRGLTVITNSLKTTLKLGETGSSKIYCAGGRLRDNSISFVRAAAKDYISLFNADIVFFSCRGIASDKGVTDASEDEAEIKRQMLRSAKTRVLLCDASKFESVFVSNLCALKDIDFLVTDADPDNEICKKLSNFAIKLIFA